jgi:bifunctional non-homologous end joining protein LigD
MNEGPFSWNPKRRLQFFGRNCCSYAYAGKDVRRWHLDDRRDELRGILRRLPNAGPIRYSESFDVPLSDLVRTVREHQLEGIVAKRAGSEYRSGERSADWVKWRANRGQEFVIGGYTLNGNAL